MRVYAAATVTQLRQLLETGETAWPLDADQDLAWFATQEISDLLA